MKRCLFLCGLVMAGCVLLSCDTADSSNPVAHTTAIAETGEAVVYLPQIPADFLAKTRQEIREGRLVLIVSGPGMQPIRMWWPISAIPDTAVVIKKIPVGVRTFTGRLVTSEGILSHEGDITATIEPGKLAKVHLKLNYSDNGVAAVCIEIEGLPLPSCALIPDRISGCWDVMVRLDGVKPDRRAMLTIFPLQNDSIFGAMLSFGVMPMKGQGNIIRMSPHQIEAEIYLYGPSGRFIYFAKFHTPRRHVEGGIVADPDVHIGNWHGHNVGPKPCPPFEPPPNCKMIHASLGKCASMQELVAALKDRCGSGNLFTYWFEKQCGMDGKYPSYAHIRGFCCRDTTQPPPPPPPCDTIIIRDTSCLSMTQWKEIAYKQCTMQGGKLLDIQYLYPCSPEKSDDHYFRGIQMICCKPSNR